jgi:hypothetical protein
MRSPSPSNAMPTSAFSASTARNRVGEVLGNGRIGMVVRKAAVCVAEQLDHLAAERAQDWRSDRTARPVAAVDDHLERPRQPAELLAKVALVLRQDLVPAERSLPRGKLAALDLRPQARDRRTVGRLATDADLEAVVLGCVVAGGHLDAAVHREWKSEK